MLDEHGDGWYYYKVLLHTTDITKAVTSNYSVFSPAFHYTKPTKTLDLYDPQWTGDGRRLVLVIGGSLGLSDDVMKRADEKLSFSKMTFPHQLMRVILLEQIYRGFKINANERYHK